MKVNPEGDRPRSMQPIVYQVYLDKLETLKETNSEFSLWKYDVTVTIAKEDMLLGASNMESALYEELFSKHVPSEEAAPLILASLQSTLIDAMAKTDDQIPDMWGGEWAHDQNGGILPTLEEG